MKRGLNAFVEKYCFTSGCADRTFSLSFFFFSRLIGVGGLTPLNPLPDDKILDRSKLKQSVNDNFKFDDNSRKFSKRVENTVGKGEITSNFSFCRGVFKRLVSQGCQHVSLRGNGLNS